MNLAYWRTRLLLLAWWSGLYLPPDRRVLERVILPRLAQPGGFKRVVFIGVRFYTRNYSRLFGASDFVTVDCNPHMRRHGARQHLVNRMENLADCFAPSSVDVIVANGVIGWGLDSRDDVNAALAASARVLATGALLVLGYNEQRTATPRLEGLPAWQHFEPVEFPGLAATRLVVPTPFDERTHTYAFFRKR